MSRKPRIMLEVDAPSHPKVLDLPSDAARWAWVVMLAKAKRHGGCFATEKQLRDDMGTRYRYIKPMRDVGLLDGLDAHDWPDHEVDRDVTAASRSKRYRERTRNRDASRDDAVTRSVHEGEGEGEVTSLPPQPPKGEVGQVWAAYLEATELRRHLTVSRQALIARRCKAYPVATVVAAMFGHVHDPWEGRHDQREIEHLLKPTNIERFASWHLDPSTRPGPGNDVDRQVLQLASGGNRLEG